jgi:hypothetical protein
VTVFVRLDIGKTTVDPGFGGEGRCTKHEQGKAEWDAHGS